jgi:sigma-E factor negative regulatory protein RseA
MEARTGDGEMTKELSALLDGEIERHETVALWSKLGNDPGLRTKWSNYQLIGDALRGEHNLSADIASRVMFQLSDEPVVLAPRSSKQTSPWYRSALALAASLAGVAVVGWLALAQPQPTRDAALMARLEQSAATPVLANVATPAQSMQEYMLAHQANASGLYLQGGAQHIRTVSAVGK